MGWLLAVCAQVSSYTTPLLAALLSYVVWSELHGHASLFLIAVDDGRSAPPAKRRFADFVAGLLVLGALAIHGIFSLDAALGEAPSRIPLIILAATVAGIAFAFGMVSMWWQFSYAVATSVWLLVAGSLAVWFSADPVPRSFSLLDGWGQNIARWILVFLVAEWLEWLAGPRRKVTLVEREVGLLTPAFGIGLALLSRPPGALDLLPPNQVTIWVVVAVVLATAMAVLLGLGHYRAARDVAWLTSFLRDGRQRSTPASAGLFTAFAFTPAIALAPVATWPAWTCVLVMGVLAVLLKSKPALRTFPRSSTSPSPT